MENLSYIIYKLIDPNNSEIRYIGMTFKSLRVRLQAHCSEKGKSHKISWIQKLKRNNLKPIIEEVESGISTYDFACEREIFWIKKHFDGGYNLTNSNTGGNKNKIMSESVRKKMSESRKKYIEDNPVLISEETRKRISASTKKRFENPLEIEKLKISNKKYEDSKTEEEKLNDILKQDCKSVLKFDRDMNLVDEFPSIRDAMRKTGIHRSNIKKCCDEKVKSAGGFIWRFKDNI
jgi:group I intron endonuclease